MSRLQNEFIEYFEVERKIRDLQNQLKDIEQDIAQRKSTIIDQHSNAVPAPIDMVEELMSRIIEKEQLENKINEIDINTLKVRLNNVFDQIDEVPILIETVESVFLVERNVGRLMIRDVS